MHKASRKGLEQMEFPASQEKPETGWSLPTVESNLYFLRLYETIATVCSLLLTSQPFRDLNDDMYFQ